MHMGIERVEMKHIYNKIKRTTILFCGEGGGGSGSRVRIYIYFHQTSAQTTYFKL